jgi:hypothetical protein
MQIQRSNLSTVYLRNIQVKYFSIVLDAGAPGWWWWFEFLSLLYIVKSLATISPFFLSFLFVIYIFVYVEE